jgi:hypothetical protein
MNLGHNTLNSPMLRMLTIQSGTSRHVSSPTASTPTRGAPICCAIPDDDIITEYSNRRTILISSLLATSFFTLPGLASPSDLARTFESREGFSFSYPDSWVVAFDRSGGRGNGAITAVGDFKQSFLVASVFRTVGIKSLLGENSGLDDTTGRRLVLDPLLNDPSTLRFRELRAQGSSNGEFFDFEYEMEACKGEVQEGKGGFQRCLSGTGQDIPTPRRHAVGRAVLGPPGSDVLFTMTASAPVEKWASVEGVLRAIVGSYHAL